jgi:hypothetical protein
MNTTQASKVIECNAIRLAAREPHKAMAGHVDAHGSEQAKALYELAQLYDRPPAPAPWRLTSRSAPRAWRW